MSLLDNVKNQMGGGDPGEASLTQAVVRFIQQLPGGLNGLMNLFREKGLGDTFSSWIGTSDNQSLTPQDVQKVFGPNRIDEFAKEANLPPGVASEQLARILPRVVDRLTPAGVIPEGGLLDQGLDFLRDKL